MGTGAASSVCGWTKVGIGIDSSVGGETKVGIGTDSSVGGGTKVGIGIDSSGRLWMSSESEGAMLISSGSAVITSSVYASADGSCALVGESKGVSSDRTDGTKAAPRGEGPRGDGSVAASSRAGDSATGLGAM